MMKKARNIPAFASRLNQLMLHEAEKIAVASSCTSILVFADAFSDVPSLPAQTRRGLGIILVSERPPAPPCAEASAPHDAEDGDSAGSDADSTPAAADIPAAPAAAPVLIQIRALSSQRFSQLRSALFVGLARGYVGVSERICCVGGLPRSDKLDAILVVDMSCEFPVALSRTDDELLPENIMPEVFERALDIATELAVEGREGKPVGCILVIGNRNQIRLHTRPLILNPFYGYPESERNILSPFMDETVKELSSIDGAFIINGDGVIESAGSMLTAQEFQPVSLPGGLGTRHVAAAAITKVTDCVAIVVSSSGQVTLFRRGAPLSLMERSSKRWS